MLSRVKRGVTAVFVAHGLLFASWAAHIPQVKAGLGLDGAALGTALFGAPLGSVLATLAGRWALPRWGSHRLIPVTVAGYAAAGTTVGLARSGPALFAALALWGMFQGALDVAMNTQAGTVERRAGAPMMARFHGMWSQGTLAGALIGAACVGAGIGLTAQLTVLGAVVLLVVVMLTRRLLPDAADSVAAPPEPAAGRRVTPTVAILAAVSFALFLCEGAATDWPATYLRDVVGAGPSVAAASYAAYTLTMVITRFGAARLHARLPSRRLLPALAVAGMSVTLATAHAAAGVLGFVALGVGVALLVPTAFSAAYGACGAGSAIASVAATGWLGYLLGPPLIGHLSGWVGLSGALVTIPVMMTIVAVAIRYTQAFDTADEFHRAPAG
nr:MFS transporter [Mycobacterium lepraemurium]